MRHWLHREEGLARWGVNDHVAEGGVTLELKPDSCGWVGDGGAAIPADEAVVDVAVADGREGREVHVGRQPMQISRVSVTRERGRRHRLCRHSRQWRIHTRDLELQLGLITISSAKAAGEVRVEG